jgi:hypothetical protein
MANLFLNYIVGDARYTHGKFRFIKGDNTVPSLDDPADTGIDDIAAYLDTDPVLFSYVNGSDPRALLVNVATDFSTTPPTSKGRYTVCVPTAAGTSFSWDFLKAPNSSILAKDVVLQLNGTDVAGNPHGIVRVEDRLFIVEYDTANIYMVLLGDLENTASGGACQVTLADDATPLLPTTAGLYHHGAALIALPGPANPYLYALFTSATIDGYGSPDQYAVSTVVRYQVQGGGLTGRVAVTAGKNATALVPVAGTNSSGQPTTYILIPAPGGKQQYGSTNGTESSLSVVDAFNGFNPNPPIVSAPVAFTGDPAAATIAGSTNYDIIGAAVSEDGANAYILTVTYDGSYRAWWRLFRTTFADILANSQTTSTPTLSGATGLSVADTGQGGGYYWEIVYDNAAGLLWFLKGTPIRVSAGGNYGIVFKEIGYGGSLYDSTFNVNSADLIGETIYQAAQGASINTRLGATRTLAKTVQAAAASAPAEEEEK